MIDGEKGRRRVLNYKTDPIHLGPPGFASFAQALRVALDEGDNQVVQEYQDVLIERLEDSKARLEDLHIPNSVESAVSPVVKTAEALFDKLGTVLDLVDEYLYDGSGDALEEAVSLLDLVQSQFKFSF